MHNLGPIAFVTLFCAAAAAVILVIYLVKRPAMSFPVKLWLFAGLGVLPAAAHASATASGMEATTHREFCGGCHVMGAHYSDAIDPASQSLAARHTRNPFFGGKSCYVCHADYGMYGYLMTKAGGMGHMYEYYFRGYKDMPLEQAKTAIHLKKPYDNTNCRQCHTTSLHDWRRVPDHESLKAELESNKVSCASAGCHGFAHAFNKPATKATNPAPSDPAAAKPAPSPSASAPDGGAR